MNFLLQPQRHQIALWLNTLPIKQQINAFTCSTRVRDVVCTNVYALPIIQWIHILGVAVICGSILLISLRMMGLLKFYPSLADMARRLLPWTWFAIVVNVITGVIMVIDRPTRALDSISFFFSMIFLVLATILSIYFAITLRRNPLYWESSRSRQTWARVLGTASALLWVGVIVGDRLIVYTQQRGPF
jgi:uncharacterized protein DUF6644